MKLRELREALGLSRNQLAGAVGVSPQTLEKYEAEMPEALARKVAEYAASRGRPDLSERLLNHPNPDIVSKPEREIDCPHCKSLIQIIGDATPKLLKSGRGISVPPEQKWNKARTSDVQLPIPQSVQEWVEVATRAVTVRDSGWREMLDNILRQLRQVANVADREQERSRLSKRGGSPGTPKPRGHGGRPDRPVDGPKAKTG